MESSSNKTVTYPKRYWVVNCHPCKTAVMLDISDFRIVSTDQAAEFIRVPEFVCGKCYCVCTVELKGT